jgi:hypothetical protein
MVNKHTLLDLSWNMDAKCGMTGVELTAKLEKLQLEAARIVTGLPAYAGWEKLIDRRNRRCICLMYNIHVVNNSAPSIDRRNRRCICLMYNIHVVNNSAPSYLTQTSYPLEFPKLLIFL